MSNQISVQELLNAQHDSTINQPSRVAASNFFATVSGAGSGNLIKSGAGVLFGVTLGSLSLTSAVTLWDNTVSGSGTIVSWKAGISAQSFFLGTKFSTGLFLSAGSVLDNITVTYL